MRSRRDGPKRRKHVPQRTCVACRQVRDARELTRVVRQPSGVVEVDQTRKRPGRGAYLCPGRRCWETALTKRLLEHALKTEIAAEEREALWQHCRSLPVESPDEIGNTIASSLKATR